MNSSEVKKYLGQFDAFYRDACAAVPQNNSFDIIGTEESCWKFLVNEKGNVTIETQYVQGDEAVTDYYGAVRRTLLSLFSPEKTGYGAFKSFISHTCLDGWLPVSVVKFRTDRFEKVEARYFADEEGNLRAAVTADGVTEYFKVTSPVTQEPSEVLELADPEPTPDDRVSFNAALSLLRSHWENKLSPVIAWDFPHEQLKKGILSALVKSFITRYDGAIRYGATRYYCDTGKSAESFPPTVITIVESALFYGLPQEALQIFGRFTEDFVSSDGEILHRGNGASVSEHGMLLETFCNCWHLTKNEDFFKRYSPYMDAVAGRLLQLIRSAGNGLIKGCPEDDLRAMPYRQWFSSNLWTARGLLAYSAVAPATLPPDEIRCFAEKTASLCSAAGVLTPEGEEFIPPCMEECGIFTDMNDFVEFTPENEVHSLSSYANYRFYPEMLSSCLLPRETILKIISWRRAHGGDFYGATAFRLFRNASLYGKERCLDDWPLYNYLRGLAHYGEYTEHARVLAGHMALHQSRGTFFAPEMSFRDCLDSTHCVPSQLTLPLAIRYLFPDCPNIDTALKE